MIGETSLYQRPKEPVVAKLSLISLMDIFTILVFFLMLNSGETQNIDVKRFVSLPESISGTALHDEISIVVDSEAVVFNETVIVDVETILAAPGEKIEPLAQLLTDNTEKLGDLAKQQRKTGYAITIMADKDVNYELLKSIMETCREENYRNISLAVNQVNGSGVPANLEGAQEQENLAGFNIGKEQ